MKFSDLTFSASRSGSVVQAFADFPNGYRASVIRGPHTYGGDRGLYELAVLRGGKVVYDTPITDDVLGYLSEAGVTEALARVAAL